MKLLMLPIGFLLFWYPQAFKVFVRSWKNTILYLEEDLAVGLMWKLIFVPLFHDSSIVGKVLSFGFRLTRVLLGLFAFALVSVVAAILMIVWFLLPLLMLQFKFLQIIFIAAIGLFIYQYLFRKSNQAKSPDLNKLAAYLEITPDQLTANQWHDLPQSTLDKLGLTPEDFMLATQHVLQSDSSKQRFFIWDKQFQVHHLAGVNRGWLSAPTPVLDTYSVDLTRKVYTADIEDFIGRSDQVKQLLSLLSLQKGRNVLLVGEPGVGKSTLVQSLAKMIVSGDAPEILATKRVVQLDVSHLLSGIQNQGDIAARLKTIFEEIRYSGQVILCLEEIADFDNEFFALLTPYLESEDLQFIATTDPVKHRILADKNPALLRVFHKLDISPASVEETMEILKVRSVQSENEQKIFFTIPALRAIVDLAKKYRADRVLPDSALQIFTEAQAVANASAENGWVTKKTVTKVVESETHIPIQQASGEMAEHLLHLEEIIHQQYINQYQAVHAIANTLRRSAAHLRDSHRPVGTFLFVGPTGTGKTEICKVLSHILFSDQMVRFDMSEYQSADQMIERLTAAISQKPYCILLLDEFEKADPQVLNLFLQVLDDGRMTSPAGKVVDFSNTLIVATSNAASLTIANGLKENPDLAAIKSQVDQELLAVFHPELLNRFDEVVIFKPLSADDLYKIVILKLAELQNQLSVQGYKVNFSQALVKSLVTQGFDPVMGARPLRRLISDTIEAKLSVLILENKLVKGELIVLDETYLNG